MTAQKWLSLKEASDYCPYWSRKLIQLAKDGKIKGGQMPDNKHGWFFDRLSIDKYMESMCIKNSAQFYDEKVVDFVARYK